MDASQRVDTDNVIIDIEVNVPAKPDFKWVGLIVSVAADRDKTTFSAFGRRR